MQKNLLTKLKKAMKKIKFSLVVCFFICNALCCLGQQDARNASLCREIEKQYHSGLRLSCFIFEHLDRWYFVSVVLPQYYLYNNQYSSPFQGQLNRQQKPNYSSITASISTEDVMKFFITTKIKNYPYYTFSTKGIKNFHELTPIYETLDKNKKKFYKMPLIGTFQADISGDAYVYAKLILDNSNDDNKPEFQKNDNVNFENRNVASNNDNNNGTNENKMVTLVVYGTADSEEEAVKVALRSAIEQAFGTFVSANTQIVNDELIKDEIVSVSSGNIEKYTLISSENLPNGKQSVCLKATVSIGKLVQYAQSKGASTEFAGQTFAYNIKMMELREKNTFAAYKNMYTQVERLIDNAFDYEIELGEVTINNDVYGKTGNLIKKGEGYNIPVKVSVMSNSESSMIYDVVNRTIKALKLSNEDKKLYYKLHKEVYEYSNNHYKNSHGQIWDNAIDDTTRIFLPISKDDMVQIYEINRILMFKAIASFINFKIEEIDNTNEYYSCQRMGRNKLNEKFGNQLHYPYAVGSNIMNIVLLNAAQDELFGVFQLYTDSYSLVPYRISLSMNGGGLGISGRNLSYMTSWSQWQRSSTKTEIGSIRFNINLPKDRMETFKGFTIKKNSIPLRWN